MKITTRLALSIFPNSVWCSMLKEWPLTKLRFKNWLFPSRRRRAAALRELREVKLHLGCGKRIIAKWTNIDCFPANGIAYECDFREPLPFADGAVKMLYSEHVIEHIQEEDAYAMLKECYRVLAHSGKIRIGVPDAEIFIRAYVAENHAFFDHAKGIGSPVRPLDTRMKVINQMARMGGHHLFAWDYETLLLGMKQTGFVNITKGKSGTSRYEGLCLDDPAHEFETLYVEAEKP